MGYDAYVHIKKKYTKLAIEKLLMLMDYGKRGIRCLKQYCDASFESHYGKNRYFPEDTLIKGAESGCYFAVGGVI